MTSFRVQEAASHRIDEIYRYTRDHWGSDQAEVYVTGLFKAFSKIATHEVLSHPIPAEFEVEGFFFRYEKHIVYWKTLTHSGWPLNEAIVAAVRKGEPLTNTILNMD